MNTMMMDMEELLNQEPRGITAHTDEVSIQTRDYLCKVDPDKLDERGRFILVLLSNGELYHILNDKEKLVYQAITSDNNLERVGWIEAESVVEYVENFFDQSMEICDRCYGNDWLRYANNDMLSDDVMDKSINEYKSLGKYTGQLDLAKETVEKMSWAQRTRYKEARSEAGMCNYEGPWYKIIS